ncbi:heavy metal translocating P-type ATPase metal-binding domain-containing protein [Fulvivirgaceae bacterium BMA10]|uniref:Heavy metal translocating P-type ATPase metal-binding domain-containing protein n=1 Tax=Splendidivirga corallicola TaxID=3051826 RepID=A0ABT8KW64_9BACT|nr:heavy metal translocating P-type ATPase metal-binding domain-containing protein [Fulvivirgaceae bacterium BMA10]
MLTEGSEKVQEKTICYHCGDDCEETPIQFEDRSFCCHGCKTVYEILNENDLCNYYDLEKNPGSSLRDKPDSDEYAFLDNNEIRNKLVDFASDTVCKVTFQIPKIHCSSCIWLLENLTRLNEHINASQVNFVKKEANITFDPGKISLRQVAELLALIGYAPNISLESYDKRDAKNSNRSLLIKIGIAGFCFGNIMLFSFPEYLGFEESYDLDFQRFFSYLNIVLALPVFFYSGSDYLVSAYKGLRRKFINIDVPIALGMVVLLARSIYEVFSEVGTGYFDSLAGLVFFLLIGKWFQSKTYENMSFERDYKAYFPLAITKIIGGKRKNVPINELKEDDEIMVRNGEIIPADSILISERSNIDYSFVTGEANPVTKAGGEYIFAGGRQVGESIRLLVKKEVSQSYLTRLWNNEIFNKQEISMTKRLIDVISQYFTIVILAIAAISGIYWAIYDPSKMWLAVTAVLIVACPCALALAVPFTSGSVQRVFGKLHCYLRGSDIVEQMMHIDAIVFDKTGTLTEIRDGQVEYVGKPLSQEEKMLLKKIVSSSIHPFSTKITDYLSQTKESKRVFKRFEEIPGKGIEAVIENTRVKLGSSKFVTGDDPGLNFLASYVFISIDDDVKGYFQMKSKYKEGLKQLIDKLKEKYTLMLLSGDNASEKNTLLKFFPANTTMLFEQKPADKLEFIKRLQKDGKKVMMLGDGLNDAGALKQSDVGIAVTEDTTSFTPACDAILEGSKLNRLFDLLSFIGISRKIVIAGFIISFLYNVIGLSFAVSGNLTPVLAAILMPLSSISVVAFATLTVNHLAKRRKLI